MTPHVDRSVRLPESEYFPDPQKKTGIALHHTVSDSARTTLDIWRRDRAAGGKPRRVATAFVIDRDGTIYEAFDPACWAWQFGLEGWSRPDRVVFEQRFIGIEITSQGGLTEVDGRLYAYDRITPACERPPAQALECPGSYRGYRWFDRYEPEQLTALGRLVNELCARFSIPRRYPDRPFRYYGQALRSFEGLIGHAMVRTDKSDPAPDPTLWKTLEDMAQLSPCTLHSALSTRPPDALFDANTRRLDRMHVAAGSLVKTLLMELARRDVYLTLETPAPDSHTVQYTVTKGDPHHVTRLARALGFAKVTERRLEVRDG